MRLYFLRHAIAGAREEWEGDDRLRPLTKKGRKKTENSVETMVLLDLKFDKIITSPLVRARQTADLVAAELHLENDLVEDERLAPGFDLDKLGQIVAENAEAEGLLFVGHEPDFSQTVSDLIGGGSVVMKKGSLARVDVADPAELKGELVWLLAPKVLTL